MSSDNSVVFKGMKDGIVVMLDKDVEFKEIRQALIRKVTEAQKFFENSSASVTFKGRELTDVEEGELMRVIKMVTGLNAASNYGGPVDRSSFYERASSNSNVMQMSDARNSRSLVEIAKENALNNTIYHRGSLRSGQAIRHTGSVVVIGDVNPGGEIIAEGNIIVLGTLKGLAHAGCRGKDSCFVAALGLVPAQLRISDIITCVAEEIGKKGGNEKVVPSYAYIHEGQIYIAPLV